MYQVHPTSFLQSYREQLLVKMDGYLNRHISLDLVSLLKRHFRISCNVVFRHAAIFVFLSFSEYKFTNWIEKRSQTSLEAWLREVLEFNHHNCTYNEFNKYFYNASEQFSENEILTIITTARNWSDNLALKF